MFTCTNWFHFLIVEVSPLINIIDHMIFLYLFPDVIRMSMSTDFLLSQLDFRLFKL